MRTNPWHHLPTLAVHRPSKGTKIRPSLCQMICRRQLIRRAVALLRRGRHGPSTRLRVLSSFLFRENGMPAGGNHRQMRNGGGSGNLTTGKVFCALYTRGKMDVSTARDSQLQVCAKSQWCRAVLQISVLRRISTATCTEISVQGESGCNGAIRTWRPRRILG